jgi:6-phosphofructokinase 1
VILIPEIPYDVHRVAEAIDRRSRDGKRFSIVAFAEGALSLKEAAGRLAAQAQPRHRKVKKARATEPSPSDTFESELQRASRTLRLAKELEELTGLESRVTMLGHLQRGGAPSATDRLLATRLGARCAELVHRGVFGVMVALRGGGEAAVPLKDVVGRVRRVPPNHAWLEAARAVGTCLGD